MAMLCDLCSKKMRVSGSYPAIVCLRMADQERRVALCSPVCVLRLFWIVGLPSEGLPPPRPKPVPCACGPSPCSVMVIEDEADLRDAMTEVLEDTGYRVVAVADGQEALAFLKNAGFRPCMILLDLMMPVMDGWTFRRHQMEDPGLADIPVVVVTAAGLPEPALAGTEVVSKPLQLDELIDVVAARCPPRLAISSGNPALSH